MRRRAPLSDEPSRDIGPYALAHRIAVGGMAEVFRALAPQQAGGDRAVVIKRMLPKLIDDPEQRAMFQHEAELGMRIDHPNVVAALDSGVDDGAPYLVLEYVFGVDLWRLNRWMVRGGQRLRVPLAVWIARELLCGLSAVHSVSDANGIPLQIIHRDVSPSNLFLSVHGDVKLGDLGIARAPVREFSRSATQGSRAKGKIGYLPPEEVTGGELDQRGDVFSAAVVAAELLMGRPLFAGGTPIGVLLAIRDGDVSPFRAAAQQLPPGLADIVLAALAREPEDRTATAAALREGLTRFVDVPEQELRTELGRLVVGALDDEADGSDRTSLAQTIEADSASFETVTPVRPHDRALRDTGPVYCVVANASDAEAVRPEADYTLAQLILAMTTGKVTAADRVRVEGEAAARSIALFPELAQHLPAGNRTPTLSQRRQMAETGELYDLSERSVTGVLLDALVARDRGLLLCEQGPVRKEIYLEDGIPCFVTSNQPGEMLGETLVASGVIDRAELDMALAMMPRFEGRLGETLVALGLVDPVTVVRSIAAQVREKLLDIFTWTHGHASLYRGVERPERAFPLDLDPWAILEDGAARRMQAGLEDPRLSKGGRNVLIRTTFDLATLPSGKESTIPESIVEVWTACAGPRTMRELEGTSAEPTRARAAVVLLLSLGALSWQGTERPAEGKRAR